MASTSAPQSTALVGGTFLALGFPVFRLIWATSLFANLGTWAQTVAAAWTLTESQAGPAMVAAIQVAAAMPVLLLSLAAGALADTHDRGWLVVLGLACECVAAGGMALLSAVGGLAPWLVLALTFAIAVGAALAGPAWQAMVGDIVPPHAVPGAVLLNSISFNLARAVGPALGAVGLSFAGPTWVFAFNAACCLVMVAAVRAVPPPQTGSYRLPPETIAEGVVAGWRFARHSVASRSVMLRAGLFGFGASSLWALLPVVAARRLRLGPEGYGILLGALGLGAVVGGLAIGVLRTALGTGRFVVTAAFAFALALAALATTRRLPVLLPLLMFGGVAWVGIVSTYNTTIQLVVPGWVRGRALALYQTALSGGLAIGSLAWGQAAEWIGLSEAIALSALLMLAALPFTARLRFPEPVASGRVTVPPPALEGLLPQPPDLAARRRPLLVLTQYRVPLERRAAFAAILREMRNVRLRNGARYWAAFRDVADPELWNEGYFVDTWLQQLRLLQRMTPEDAAVVARAATYHAGTEPPQTRRVIVHDEPDP